MSGLTIGELAQRLQCQPATIRFYEREGLLPAPARSGGNYRLYGSGYQERLSFILRCRSLDMTLDEIRELLRLRDAPAGSCTAVNAALDEHIRHVGDRITQLRALQRQLRQLRNICDDASGGSCGILEELSRGTRRYKGAMPHVPGPHTTRRDR